MSCVNTIASRIKTFMTGSGGNHTIVVQRGFYNHQKKKLIVASNMVIKWFLKVIKEHFQIFSMANKNAVHLVFLRQILIICCFNSMCAFSEEEEEKERMKKERK